MKAPTLQELLAMASNHGASDLLLQEGKAPVLRINGQLHTLETEAVAGEQLSQLWAMCGANESANDHDASLATEAGQRFRANLHGRLGERGAVLRHIKTQIPTMDALGVPADLLRDWGARTSGMVIVTGPTGSGKSTTLAALIEHINSTAARHIVTIEDPIEYVFTPDRSVITQREVGLDTASFAEGLRRSLRQDPDVILVGEVRDRESAVTALQAAETGHLVLATLHASACAEAAERLEFLFSAGERDGVRPVALECVDRSALPTPRAITRYRAPRRVRIFQQRSFLAQTGARRPLERVARPHPSRRGRGNLLAHVITFIAVP